MAHGMMFAPTERVECGSCSACCRGDQIIALMKGDDPTLYETEPAPVRVTEFDLGLQLRHKPDGDCLYLDAAGKCSIYYKRPTVCRTFSCVGYARKFMALPRSERRRQRRETPDNVILREGLARIGAKE